MIPKRLLLQVHRWSGLVAAILILLQAGAGSLLVFRAGFAELVDPAGMVRHSDAGDVRISHVMSVARAHYPGFGIERVAFPQSAHGVYLVHLLNPAGAGRWVSVDPGTGAVLRTGGVWAFPGEAALQIHFRLMTGRVGLATVMLVGVSLLTMAATGLSYWWPKRGRLRRSLVIDTRLPGKVVLRQFHRTLGVVCAASAIFSATTGLLVAGEFFLAPGPITEVAASGGAIPGDVDAALDVARAAYPGRAIRDVRTPQLAAFNVFFWAPEMSPHAVHRVRIDLTTDRIVDVTPAQKAGGLWMTLLPIHSGDTFGRAGSLVILLGALGLMTLAATGPIVWLVSRRRQ